jgi:RNA polymerase sigma factor (sigma-70 family)
MNSDVNFNKVLDEYKPLIDGIAYKMAFYRLDLLEDLKLAGYEALFETWTKFDKDNKSKASFKTFLYFFLKNRMIDELRVQTLWFGKRYGLVDIEYIDNEDSYVPLNGSGEDHVDLTQKYDMLKKACLSLPTKQREVILNIMEGNTQKDIAVKFGVTESRISQLYKKSVRDIKDILGIKSRDVSYGT